MSSSDPELLTLFSLGHSNQPLETFLALVGEHEIGRVVDVRRYPASRRHPHFSRESLALELPRSGVHYVHLVDLGGQREPRPDSAHTALSNGPFRGYADHMETAGFARALAHLLELARERRTAVMCAEARWSDCHRRLLCDRLVSEGARVVHVQKGTPAESHRLAAGVSLVEGRLLYRGSVQPGLFDAHGDD